MAGSERGIFPRGQEFQPVIRYREPENSPSAVASQTYALLELCRQGAIRDRRHAAEYFEEYTIAYLEGAEKGSAGVYNRRGVFLGRLDLEIEEKASHALVVFSHLPGSLESDFLSTGFSRIGTLKPPQTREEFLERLKELRTGIRQVAEGELEPGTFLLGNTRLLRTFGFFRVASGLPVKSKSDEGKNSTPL